MLQALSRPSETMRRVNELISESLGAGGREDPVPFFCECGDPGCFRAVWLSPARYAEQASDPQWAAVAGDHEPTRPPTGHFKMRAGSERMA